MIADQTRPAGQPGRRWSLRREWSRAFAIMLGLLLVSAVATIVGVRLLVAEVQGTAAQLHRESVTVATLQTNLVDHEQTAHKLLSDEPIDRSAFIQQQEDIDHEFVRAAKIFPAADGMRAIVLASHASWIAGLQTYHLWGDQALAMHGDHSADNPTFGASSDATDALLDGLEGPSLDAMNAGLSHGIDLEHALIFGLAALFALAMATIVYFRRRMTRDLVRPVARLLQGVLTLQSGNYEHRIEVARRDELGELAQAFNDMAHSLHESHLTLTRRATNDPLTGLANRTSLAERLTAAFGPGTESRASHESLLFIDIDDFKNVNDLAGHAGGDHVLVQLAARLTDCVRPYDLVARLGGDEFAIVVVEDHGACVATEVAERILTALRAPFVLGGTRLSVGVSIGIAHRRPETVDSSELLRDADFAMYMAKGQGKSRFQLYDPLMHQEMLGHTALKADLAVAVAADQLRIDYQPVADLDTGAIVGVEALVRWQHPTRGLILPDEFIPVAEHTGDIDAIGQWVLQTATKDAAAWRAALPERAALWTAINVSAAQINDPTAMAAITSILADPAVDAATVVLEITETALAADLETAVITLGALRESGVRIAIDDFGTGFSSLSALARLPVDILKIDRSFISGQPEATPSRPMLEGIVGLANRLELPIVAEGIEEPEQLALLRRLGCPMGQGFLLARPMPADDIAALLGSAEQLCATVALR